MAQSDATAFTDWKKRRALASRGKAAEDQVADWCKDKQSRMPLGFDWERNPDSRAAGSRKFVVRTGDFYMYCNSLCACVEVKETSKSSLPKANFDAGQIARGYKRQMAGVLSPVLVHFTDTDRWVVAPVDHFFNNKGPWSLAGFPSFSSAYEALDFALQPLFNT